ncbi:MAG: SDR family NAD(P)-dependent oxidoreductase [Proteobacteria bacterium]|nr:SDR family NAD(P)-dependent oxidoreductase [Pseudomonadota bacterium]MDA0899744.1 SDR family NAD(P)-dependent oxidoreductase [Pseudomonadota bacterium]MDA1056619.1 SDR family NAD(P)-dependent oxidoreductase [Pseudomonadota bacterium]
MSLDFKGKVAIVTGSGGGIGKGYALELARRGAKVVVNDLGGSVDGTGGSVSAAEAVVQEIEANGGEALANGANVSNQSDVKDMVESTISKWGRVDILINNAGILRDKSFGKMEWEDFVAVINVHLLGSALCAHSVFPVMKEQEYGRIIMTSSSSGLFGNFGQTNYAAAKMGVVGLMNTLKLEGAKYNVHTNSIAPTATTRMTEHLFPAEFGEQLDPKYIIPAVVYLASEKAPNGEILEAGGGVVANTYVMETMGKFFGTDENFTAEAVAESWAEIADTNDARRPFQGGDVALKHFETIQKTKK